MDGMMADREKRTGKKIKEGYCFETDSIEGPLLAAEKQHRAKAEGDGLHYFCTTQDCIYPIIPCFSRKEDYDIAWFTNHKRDKNTPSDHIPDCPNGIGERKKASGHGVSRPPRYEPNLGSDLFIPEQLVHPSQMNQRQWSERNPPSPTELRHLINSARGKPAVGSLEDVMKAHRVMSEAYKASLIADRPVEHQKSEKRLIIGDNDTNYNDGIAWFPKVADRLDEAPETFWGRQVFWISGIPKQDEKSPGSYYINPKKDDNFFIWIKADLAEQFKTKAYLAGLLEEFAGKKANLRCYWWDLRPSTSRFGKRYLRIEDEEGIQRLALIRLPEAPSPAVGTGEEGGERPV